MQVSNRACSRSSTHCPFHNIMLDLNRPFKDRNGRFVFKWTTCSNDVRRMTMSGTKDNRRVQYTMDRFKDALLHILATKPLDEVSR